jgi:uncharacterized protein with PQ loop repeat
MEKYLELCAMVASVLMPFFNIPLILRIINRHSSNDLSLLWVLGVYICMLLMLPYGILYGGVVLKAFSITNVIFFSIVVFVTMLFRGKKTS